jgi:chorismate mutase
MTALSPDTPLDAIRREIDLIDDQILNLLGRRFAATSRVRATKARDGSIASSPLRPAREAAMLRRLIAQAGDTVAPDVLVRLWRVILSASTQAQAPITLHMDEAAGADLGARLLIGEHFCDMQVSLHADPARALHALRGRRGDLAILATGCDWAGSFTPDKDGDPQVIGILPVLSTSSAPRLLVFGYAEPQESGDDETLVITRHSPAGLSAASWQCASGECTLAGIPGFHGAHSPLLRELTSRLPGTCVAGRYPRPIKVST